MHKIIFISLLFLANINSFSQKIAIIPQPTSLVEKNGYFSITANATIHFADSATLPSVDFLTAYLKAYYGNILTKNNSIKNSITLNLDKTKPDESYILQVDSNGINITGGNAEGVFYGVQTLIQLIPINSKNNLNIPFVHIEDSPAFAYRGMHLDVSRHFFSVEFIKKYIDYLALHKMNYLHWHLTDDQGWRIEIKKYPALTTVGAWRNGTYVIERKRKNHKDKNIGNDNKKHGRFYTQDEIKDIVAYAGKRYITIIPEIEMPGHSNAAIAAYPYLSCFPNEPSKIKKYDLRRTKMKNRKKIMRNLQNTTTGKQVRQYWGVSEDVLCAGKDSTFLFLEDVLNEIIPLFPSKYIHIGGDECPKVNWKKCPACSLRMHEQHLPNTHALQSYFIKRIEDFLQEKGKTIIGWDEILQGGLAKNAVVMSWRGEQGGIKAAKEKHPVIMAPSNYVYLDHPNSKKDDENRVFKRGYLPIKKIYLWSVIPKKIQKPYQKYILGGEACVWTEYINSEATLNKIVFPRIAAVSEALWTSKVNKNYNNFSIRLQSQKQRYLLWGIDTKPK